MSTGKPCEKSGPNQPGPCKCRLASPVRTKGAILEDCLFPGKLPPVLSHACPSQRLRQEERRLRRPFDLSLRAMQRSKPTSPPQRPRPVNRVRFVIDAGSVIAAAIVKTRN